MRLKTFFATLLLVAAIAFSVNAAHATMLHNFDCAECHRSGADWTSVSANNVCLTCHGSAPVVSQPMLEVVDWSSFPATFAADPDSGNGVANGFNVGDASNKLGSNAAPGNETSHNWGAYIYNPRAGSAANSGDTMYTQVNAERQASGQHVTCFRCHDPHGAKSAPRTANNKLVRFPNYNREVPADMVPTPAKVESTCVICHADWAAVTQAENGLESHPLVTDYPTFQAGNSSKYRPFTPSGEMTLVNGTDMGCTTCHGLHNTDSDSVTPDGFGVVGGDGALLRGDGVFNDQGAVCESCHIYQPHPGGNSIGCMVCHSGHSYNDGTPNHYLLRGEVASLESGGIIALGAVTGPKTGMNQYTTIPADAAEKAAFLGGTLPGTVDGYCEACHGDVEDAGFSLNRPHNNGEDCTQCHVHNDTNSFAAQGCDTCHGFAPETNTQGGPTGYAFVNASNSYPLIGNGYNEALTPHASHADDTGSFGYAFACERCHNSKIADFSTTHNTGTAGASYTDATYQNVLESAYSFTYQSSDLVTAGVLTSPGGGYGTNFYNTGTANCTVYCHSNGGTYTGAVKVAGDFTTQEVNWVNTKNTIIGSGTECSSCHGNSVATMAVGDKDNSQTHNAHLSKGYTCNVCHNSTATSNTAVVTNGGDHVDGQVDLALDNTFNLGAAVVGVGSLSGASCSVYCHSDGSGTNSSPDWAVAASGNCGTCHSVNGATLPDAHAIHLTDTNGPQIASCNVCHTHNGSGADHVDGEYDVQATACDTCHGKPGGGWTGVGTVDEAPVWTNPASVNCETCHSGTVAVINAVPAPLVAEAAYNNGHGKAGVAQACTDCHEANTVAGHLGGASVDRLSGILPAYVAANDVAFCTDCHVATTNNHSTADGTICKTCHTQHGEANGFDAMIMSTVAGNAVTGFTTQGVRASYVNATNTGICQTCHTTQNYFSKTLFDDAGHNPGLACSDCHSHDSTPKAFAGVGDSCDACHGYPPATAAHSLHAPDSFTADAGGKVYRDGTNGFADVTACAFCHTGADLYTYDFSADQASVTPGRVNHNAGEATQDATLLATVGYDNTDCATACHNTASGQIAGWTSGTIACDACHYQAADPTQAGNTGFGANAISAGHNAHFAGGGAVVCTDCHANVTDSTHITSVGVDELTKVTNMADALQDEAALIAGVTFDDGLNTCATASCHNNGRPGTSVVTSAWGTDDPNCTQCHAASPTTGSHTIHIPDATDCSDCHTSALQNTSYISTEHYDGNIDVSAGSYPTNKLVNSAFTSCTTATCHDDGRSANTTPNWGTVAANPCIACHDAIPATGSHASHVADAAVDCTDCHAGAVQITTAPTTGHRDDNIDTNVALGYSQNKIKGSAFETCATASCHNDGRNSGLTGTWGTTINNCAECHATAPTTGSHTAHLSDVQLAVACSDCHSGVTEGTTAGAGHRDGNIDTVAGLGNTANKTLGSAFENCTTASCHDDGTGTVVASPVWGSDTNCATCHATQPTTGSHTAHIVDASAACGDCHSGAVEGTNAGGNHIDTNIDTVVTLGYPQNKIKGSAVSNCATVSCHGDGLNPGDGATPNWGTAAGCAACHESNMTTGSHTIHLTYTSGACVACHDDANTITENAPAQHGDGNVDVFDTAAGDLGYTVNAAIGSVTWSDCSAASCHDDGRSANTTPNWGTPASNACTACHDTIPATGSHASHVADAAVDCTDCHAGAVQGTTKPTAGHDDGNIDTTAALGYSQNKIKGSAFETCATASCHNDGRNSGLTGTWGTTLNNCSECHATTPATGSHTDHLALYACATCHTGVTEGTTAGAGHRDGNIDTAASTGLTANKALGSAFTSCSTNICHGSNSPVWGTDLDANDQCTQCHGQLVAGPATDAQKAPGGLGVDTNGDSIATDAQVGAHQIHLNPTMSAVVACSACHAVPGTVTAAGHIDSALPAELTFSGRALGGQDGQAPVAPANSQAGCATTYCHDGAAIKNGWDGGLLSPTWTNTSFISGVVGDCDNCHGYPPAGGHVANTDCSACHDVMNADDLTFTAAGKLTHVNGVVDASGGDNCTDCHGADIDNALNGVHGSHADTATFLSGKTVSGGDYGGAGWYGTTYVNGQPLFGCGQCHDGSEGTGHPTAGLNVDIDPAGETPGAGNVKTFNGVQSTPTFNSRVSVTCASVYCHSDASGTFATTPDWYGGSIGTACTDCHGNSPSTNAHGIHEVGIHYEELYNGTTGLLTATGTTGSGAGHGDSTVSTTITCYTCHSATVTDSANAANSTCTSCHSDTNNIATGNELARILTTSSTHVNGLKDVSFATAGFKSRAQLRDNLSDADDGTNLLSDIWNRITGYKAVASRDERQGVFGAPSFVQGADTCSNIACHNGNTATWSDSGVDCTYCHSSLPK